MVVKIKKIQINALRGIRDLGLDLEGKSLLIKGENGTGKSSIVDAIEFFFKGKISHLTGNEFLSLEKHAPHIKLNKKDTKVEFVFNPETISLNRTFSSEYNVPEPLKEYFNVALKRTFILRRSQLLYFIISKPSERFRAIGDIIGIDNLDNLEVEMMRLSDELVGKVSSKQQQINEYLKEISNLLNSKVENIGEILPALNKIFEKGGITKIESLEEIDLGIESILKKTRKKDNLTKFEILTELVLMTENPIFSQGEITKLKSLSEQVENILKNKKQKQISYVELLKNGKEIMENEEIDKCPLCEQSIDKELLLKEVKNRLETLSTLSNEASNIRKLSTELIELFKTISKRIQDIVLKMEKFSEFKDKTKEFINYFNSLNKFLLVLEEVKEIKRNIEFKSFEDLMIRINKVNKEIYDSSKKSSLNIDILEKVKEFLNFIVYIEQIKGRINDFLKINKELEECAKHFKIAEKIYNNFSESKKEKIKEIYKNTEKDIQNFYTKIHPNELHSNIKLELILDRRASTKIKIDSFGKKGEDPRGFISEGHLDSLGLCIFLAFVKNFNEGCSLIVLDDVVSTVDSRHRKDICKLLLEDFKDAQLIITTHDFIWYNQIIDLQRVCGKEGNFSNLSIIGWDLDYGPKIQPYKLRWERIQEKIANGDNQGAGGEGRIYLEWVLGLICELMEVCTVHKSSGKYEIKDLLNPTKKRLGYLIKNPKFKKETEQLFKKLEGNIALGNLLSHNNLLAEQIVMNEIKDFCNIINKIHKHFLCPSCNNPLQYVRMLKRIRCCNGNCKTPFEVETN